MENIIKEAGNILHYETTDYGLIIKCENANIIISFYSSAIVRIEVSFNNRFENFSYAVEAEPAKNIFQLDEKEKFLELKTANFITEINKTPFAVTFKTIDGYIINCDEPGLYNSIVESSVTAYKTMQPGERFIGLGEKYGALDKAGKGYTNINTDEFAYNTDADPLYATFPFYIGIHNNLNYGIFLDNTFQTDFNFGASNNRFSSFGARGGNLNYYFIYHKHVSEIIKSYTYLTGRMPLPPKWSLGYHQNRYSYYPDSEVERITHTLREKKIPCDSITLDIHYMDEYKPFTWDKNRFPKPADLIARLNNNGFKTTVMLDPGVEVNDKGEEDIYIKYPDGKDYEGQVWPGWCSFPDFTNDEARKWWGEKIKSLLDKGVEGIWNDMNEIATWGQKMPDNIIFHYEGEKASHLKARNIYALQMCRSSYEGYVNFIKKRPFMLTRAAYAGIQRYSAVWTGDNTAEDSHMLMGIRMLMSMGITGVAFTGMDIGGFLHEPSPNLYARWMQLGAFTPYMRNHKQVNTKSSEPWTYGEEVMEVSRNYISLRYRLMPYIYSLFREASQTGMPVVRTLAIEHTFDDNVYNHQFDNQFYFGDAIMVAPFDSVQKYGEVYFPEGDRYDLYYDSLYKGGKSYIMPLIRDTLPVFVNESSIIPMQDLVQHTMQNAGETLYIHVYKGNKVHSFNYYEDDGESFDYLSGKYYERKITYNPDEHNITLDKPSGEMESKFSKLKIVFHGFDTINSITVNNAEAKVNDESYSFLEPISAFKPQAKINKLSDCNVKYIELENYYDKTIINIQ